MSSASVPGRLTLKSAAFRAEREASWQELERLLERVQGRGLGALKARELLRLPLLYRAALSSLSVARAISLDRALLEYLESLCARAYLVVYGVRRGMGEAVGDFFRRRLPRLVRAHWPHLLLSYLVLLAGVWVGFALTRADPDRFFSFVPAVVAQGRSPASTTEALRSILYDDAGGAEMLKAFAMALFTHNSFVSLAAFAGGFAGGVPSALFVFVNGLTLGAFAAIYDARGLSLDFWGWILPHGVAELTAVVLCCAAGLAIGQALVFPGREERKAALMRRGREAATLALGAVALLLFAGLVEGIFRQRVHSIEIRYAVAGTSALLLALYAVFAGRGKGAA